MQVHSYIPFIKNHTKLFLAVCFGVFSYFQSIAQQLVPLRVKYNFIVDGGSRDGSRVSIERDGQKWRSRDGDDGKNYIDLEYQHDYVFSFSKQGYVTKKIFFSTKVPKSMLKDGFDPYAFDITIFKQMEGVDLMVFNQPVARVIFNEDLDDFGYDTDYTKTVLAGIQEAEKELKKKIKEEKANPKAAAKSEETAKKNSNEGGGATETAKKSSSEADGGTTETTKKSSSEASMNPSGAIENDSRNRNKASAENEKRDPPTVSKVPDKRDEKQYVEGSKRITEITITRKGKIYVYKKVVYIWGVFYFRDNISITESSFVQEAL
jgi:hypothetical protein